MSYNYTSIKNTTNNAMRHLSRCSLKFVVDSNGRNGLRTPST